jgi:hypothetical protein
MTPIDMTLFGVNGEFESETHKVVGITLTSNDTDDLVTATIRFYNHYEGNTALNYAQARGITPNKAVFNACARIMEGDYKPDNFARAKLREAGTGSYPRRA